MTQNPNEPYIDPNTVKGRPATSEEQAYRDGYVSGRVNEDRAQANLRIQRDADSRARASNDAASGLLIGVLVALIAAAIGGIAFYLSRDTAVPETQAPTENNTVIETPQVEPPEVEVPDVNVTVPDVNITAPEAPAPEAPVNEAPSEPVEAAPPEPVEAVPEASN